MLHHSRQQRLLSTEVSGVTPLASGKQPARTDQIAVDWQNYRSEPFSSIKPNHDASRSVVPSPYSSLIRGRPSTELTLAAARRKSGREREEIGRSLREMRDEKSFLARLRSFFVQVFVLVSMLMAQFRPVSLAHDATGRVGAAQGERGGSGLGTFQRIPSMNAVVSMGLIRGLACLLPVLAGQWRWRTWTRLPPRWT